MKLLIAFTAIFMFNFSSNAEEVKDILKQIAEYEQSKIQLSVAARDCKTNNTSCYLQKYRELHQIEESIKREYIKLVDHYKIVAKSASEQLKDHLDGLPHNCNRTVLDTTIKMMKSITVELESNLPPGPSEAKAD